ncbi:SDR family oxidoreductase [Lusitaniella coriacea LEGE 07157]|uniref:SDR family oxidoreductase n=2 Tax=Lusitaniella TaxID=1983104 RepID=A0A8J7JEH4_9CYAN|nr:SDR family oxidoreductase [Lusitaniella coriacea LEGE 07157]
MDISPEEMEICLRVLQTVSEDVAIAQSHDRFKSLVAKIYKQGKKIQRGAERVRRASEDWGLKEETQLVQSKANPLGKRALPQEGKGKRLNRPVSCYICKQPYRDLHFFYHLLCPTCAALNYDKRSQRADLTGRTALVTGGRVKIGYQVVLRLLRDRARTIITTRFPVDCARRLSGEPDFEEWRDRAIIYGLDLRYLPGVEAFVRDLRDREPFLDILINNAAQTIKRPLGFYQHLLERERAPLHSLPSEVRGLIANEENRESFLLENQMPSQPHFLPTTIENFPANILDEDGQQLDLRPLNSWLLKLDEVSTTELLEVQLVNAIAPFILTGQLKSLLARSPAKRRFIINVSAMEGQFNRQNKTIYHPHTNMAKAALNMMTRTSAADYAKDGVYLNSVDTGWITDENPYSKKTHLQNERGFYPPLDLIDGMARIYDPIAQGINHPDIPLYGHFLKNYVPYPW